MTRSVELIDFISPMVPKSVKRAIKQAAAAEVELDDHFRPCSPANLPEVAQSLVELRDAGLLEGGCYYEFGLFRGFALWFAAEMTRRFGVQDFHSHGFDSFRGLPEPTGVDEGAPWAGGSYAVPKAQVESYLRQHGADFSRISLHEGFFSDELFASLSGRVNFGRPALVLVDCDLYASTVPVLRFLAPRLVNGTIVLFDDYNCFKASDEKGQRRALREFLAVNPDLRFESLRPFGWHGQGFRVQRT